MGEGWGCLKIREKNEKKEASKNLTFFVSETQFKYMKIMERRFIVKS